MKTSAQIKAFRKWWASKEKAGYQYGPGPLATVAFGFEAGWEARQAYAESGTSLSGSAKASDVTSRERPASQAPKSPGEERRRLAEQRKQRRAKA